MATRKAGTRRIIIDDVEFRWRIRSRATNFQADYGIGTLHIAVELASGSGSLLVIITNRQHPAMYRGIGAGSISPNDVATLVRGAISSGWQPSRHGPQFLYREPVSNSHA